MPNVTYWGGQFPDPGAGQLSYWGGHFPEGSYDPAFTPGVGDPGAATFVLGFESGFKVTYSWETDVFKAYDGSESRAARTSLPKSRFAGDALLTGNTVLANRGVLARFAASGQAFLLGLRHEAIAIKSSSGTTINVDTTNYLDWLVAGGRVAAVSGDGLTVVNAVIQSWTSNTIVTDVAIGIGIGGSLMPAVAVYFDPQQGFQRYRPASPVEMWQIAAHAIPFGYEQLDRAAFRVLSGDTAGAFHNATVISAYTGTSSNGKTLTLVADGAGAGSVTTSGINVTFHYQSGTTTVGNAQSALAPYFSFSGTLPASSTTLVGGDAFGPVSLANGLDRIFGNMGVGATLTQFDFRAVWDRPIQLDTTANDGVQAMTELVDLGGKPSNFGTAKQPDWSRHIQIARLDKAEWQWLKLFLYTVRGRQRSFLLPTWRADLTPVSLAPGVLKISSTVGDFFAWYPYLTRVQVMLADGSVGYCSITGVTDNGDGTLSLAITTSLTAYNTGGGGSTLTNLQLVSWLEVVRFESDDFEITWSEGLAFSLSTQARVVPQGELVGFYIVPPDVEGSWEDSQPREFVEVTHGATTYRWALGDRDITYQGNTFTATTSARAEITVAPATGEQTCVLSIPASHPLARRYVALGGVPPRQVLITLRRVQLGTGVVEQLWSGYITSMAFDRHLAKLSAPDRIQRSLQRRLPTVVNDGKCTAVLYDSWCKANKATFTVSATAFFVDGRSVSVPGLTGKPDDWAKGGRLVHVPSGETMLILEQKSINLTLQAGILELKSGDAVQVIAACKHDVDDCRNKFSNARNYVGFPNRPTRNPVIPTGAGTNEDK